MRFRLGLLQDAAAIDKQLARDAAERKAEEAEKRKAHGPKTEAQTKADERAKERGHERHKEVEKPKTRPKIRPLSEAKAIDSGANFVSETFLLVVAIGTLFGERYYSSKKENSRREDVAERIEGLEEYERNVRKGMLELEKEVLRLRGEKAGLLSKAPARILPKEVYELEQEEESDEKQPKGWLSWFKAAGITTEERQPEPAAKAAEEHVEAADAQPQVETKTLYDRILHPTATASQKEAGEAHPSSPPSSSQPTSEAKPSSPSTKPPK